MSHLSWNYWSWLTLFCLISTGCAASAASTPPPEYAKNPSAPCNLIGVDADSAPVHDNFDSASVVAVYRVPESHAKDTEPFEVKALVHQSSMDPVRGSLDANPDVICRPVPDNHSQPEPSHGP